MQEASFAEEQVAPRLFVSVELPLINQLSFDLCCRERMKYYLHE